MELTCYNHGLIISLPLKIVCLSPRQEDHNLRNISIMGSARLLVSVLSSYKKKSFLKTLSSEK